MPARAAAVPPYLDEGQRSTDPRLIAAAARALKLETPFTTSTHFGVFLRRNPKPKETFDCLFYPTLSCMYMSIVGLVEAEDDARSDFLEHGQIYRMSENFSKRSDMALVSRPGFQRSSSSAVQLQQLQQLELAAPRTEPY